MGSSQRLVDDGEVRSSQRLVEGWDAGSGWWRIESRNPASDWWRMEMDAASGWWRMAMMDPGSDWWRMTLAVCRVMTYAGSHVLSAFTLHLLSHLLTRPFLRREEKISLGRCKGHLPIPAAPSTYIGIPCAFLCRPASALPMCNVRSEAGHIIKALLRVHF